MNLDPPLGFRFKTLYNCHVYKTSLNATNNVILEKNVRIKWIIMVSH